MNDGLILDVDWNIDKAEAKQRKLNREFELSKLKAESITKSIEELNAELEKEKMAQTDIKDSINIQLEESKQLEKHIEKLKHETASIADTMKFGGLSEANQRYRDLEKNIKQSEQSLAKIYNKQQSITKEITKQKNSLSKQNAKTADIGDKIASNTTKQNKFTGAFEKSQKSIAKFGKRFKMLALYALVFSLITKALTAMRNEFGELITESKSRTAKLVAQLKGSLAVLGRTIYESVKPYIEWILDKLIKIVNILTNGLAKVLGKNVNQMKKLAENTKKTSDAAQKTTASFDTLQTLEYNNGSTEDAVDTSAIQSKFTYPKEVEKFLNTINIAYQKVKETIEKVIEKNKELKEDWDKYIQPIIDWVEEELNDITKRTGEGLAEILEIFATDDWIEFAKGLITTFALVWSFVKGGLNEAKTVLTATFKLIANVLSGLFRIGSGVFEALGGIVKMFVGVWTWLVGIFTDDTEKMNEGTALMKEGFRQLLNGIIKIFSGIVNVLSSVVNWIWEHICGALRGLVNSIGGLVSKVGDLLGFENWGWEWNFKTPRIPQWNPPALASGAVIPGGSPFYAILGDQPKGKTNLEAPEDLIRQIVREESSAQFEIVAKGSLAPLIRLLNLEIKKENKRASVF